MNRKQSLGSHSWLGRASRLTVAAAVLFAGTPAVATLEPVAPLSTTTTTVTGAFAGEGHWKIQLTPDAAAVAAGRDPFIEYSVVDGERVQFHELARLGFKITSLSATPGLLSTPYTMTIKSRECGTMNISGTATLTTNNGTATWTTNDGKVYKYNYTGTPYTPVEAES